MNVFEILKSLTKDSLLFLCVCGFNSKDVVEVCKNNQGYKFLMKDGSIINV